MTSVNQYKDSLQEILDNQTSFKVKGNIAKGKAKLGLEFDTVAEARQHMKVIRQMQKEMRQVKREINATMKGIRARYREQAGRVQPGWISIFRGKGAQRSSVASQKKDLRKKQDRELTPYDDLKVSIDGILLQLDNTKLKVETWIEQNK